MGFSFIETLIGILIVFSSILCFIKFPPKNIPADVTDAGVIYTILERVGQMCQFSIIILFYVFI
jgi:Tfp pilus assembly protein PilV